MLVWRDHKCSSRGSWREPEFILDCKTQKKLASDWNAASLLVRGISFWDWCILVFLKCFPLSPWNGEGASRLRRRASGSHCGCKALPTELMGFLEKPFRSFVSAPWSVLLLLRRKSRGWDLLLIRSGLIYKPYQWWDVILKPMKCVNVTAVISQSRTLAPKAPHGRCYHSWCLLINNESTQ